MSMPAELIRPHVTLAQLLKGFANAPAIQIHGLASDSRRLGAGDVFVALDGSRCHGLDFLAQALDAGVAAVLFDPATAAADPRECNIPLIPVAGLATRVGDIANRWFGTPSATMAVTGVTGTNGKTTVAFLIAQCRQLLQDKAAYIGTLGAGMDELSNGGMTTPACIDLHELLARFHDSKATHVALEVSSHGIQQERIAGVQFDSAIFTNLTRDHIDYHGDMESYGNTKARLFLEHKLNHRIINIDCDFGKKLAARCSENLIVVSIQKRAKIQGRPHAVVQRMTALENGIKVSVATSWGNGELILPLYGDFNVANAVAVLALLLAQGVSMHDACGALQNVSPPSGRMQRLQHSAMPAVFVDYAHTPAGLQSALQALRPHCAGKLWCIFGCGGERDQGKRPMMGEIAARLADHTVVTNDNPRSEAPGTIIRHILSGMTQPTVVIEDRAAAIAYAISQAGDDDLILIAGKGHEQFQHTGDERRPFSDQAIALANLAVRQAPGGTRT
ncbi:MAG: UDP-N-acetylmuramoyl-L-alanyl-D-glutamate--2,6-diaminopimelate ligase [Gammaproteobacteria bacterium]|nr:UDP-N-acetylmuramoyl-L-alanyl-D-glutamate--2,6-diaminopimelate ligase [Gammaproteobacteria bacterium]